MNKFKNAPPIGKVFMDVAKVYFGVLAERLEHTGIDRYFYTLMVINEGKGKLTQQKLSDMLKMDKVTTVRVIDYLSKKELVKREVNENDRREHLLMLTKKGQKIMPEICDAIKDMENELFEGISDNKRADFSESMHLIIGNLSRLPSKKMKVKVKFDKIKRPNK